MDLILTLSLATILLTPVKGNPVNLEELSADGMTKGPSIMPMEIDADCYLQCDAKKRNNDYYSDADSDACSYECGLKPIIEEQSPGKGTQSTTVTHTTKTTQKHGTSKLPPVTHLPTKKPTKKVEHTTVKATSKSITSKHVTTEKTTHFTSKRFLTETTTAATKISMKIEETSKHTKAPPTTEKTKVTTKEHKTSTSAVPTQETYGTEPSVKMTRMTHKSFLNPETTIAPHA